MGFSFNKRDIKPKSIDEPIIVRATKFFVRVRGVGLVLAILNLNSLMPLQSLGPASWCVRVQVSG